MPFSGKDLYNDQTSISRWAPAIRCRDQARVACHTRFKSKFMMYIVGGFSKAVQVSRLISFEWRKRIIRGGERSLRALNDRNLERKINQYMRHRLQSIRPFVMTPRSPSTRRIVSPTSRSNWLEVHTVSCLVWERSIVCWVKKFMFVERVLAEAAPSWFDVSLKAMLPIEISTRVSTPKRDSWFNLNVRKQSQQQSKK